MSSRTEQDVGVRLEYVLGNSDCLSDLELNLGQKKRKLNVPSFLFPENCPIELKEPYEEVTTASIVRILCFGDISQLVDKKLFTSAEIIKNVSSHALFFKEVGLDEGVDILGKLLCNQYNHFFDPKEEDIPKIYEIWEVLVHRLEGPKFSEFCKAIPKDWQHQAMERRKREREERRRLQRKGEKQESNDKDPTMYSFDNPLLTWLSGVIRQNLGCLPPDTELQGRRIMVNCQHHYHSDDYEAPFRRVSTISKIFKNNDEVNFKIGKKSSSIDTGSKKLPTYITLSGKKEEKYRSFHLPFGVLTSNFFHQLIKFSGTEVQELNQTGILRIQVLRSSKDLESYLFYLEEGPASFFEGGKNYKIGFSGLLGLLVHADMFREMELVSCVRTVLMNKLYCNKKNEEEEKMNFEEFGDLEANEDLKKLLVWKKMKFFYGKKKVQKGRRRIKARRLDHPSTYRIGNERNSIILNFVDMVWNLKFDHERKEFMGTFVVIPEEENEDFGSILKLVEERRKKNRKRREEMEKRQKDHEEKERKRKEEEERKKAEEVKRKKEQGIFEEPQEFLCWEEWSADDTDESFESTLDNGAYLHYEKRYGWNHDFYEFPNIELENSFWPIAAATTKEKSKKKKEKQLRILCFCDRLTSSRWTFESRKYRSRKVFRNKKKLDEKSYVEFRMRRNENGNLMLECVKSTIDKELELKFDKENVMESDALMWVEKSYRKDGFKKRSLPLAFK